MSVQVAWYVTDRDEGYSHFFHAPIDASDADLRQSAGAALNWSKTDSDAIDRDDIDRAPEMDGLEFTAENLLESGAVSWYECQGCGGHIESEGDGPDGRSVGRWDDETETDDGEPLWIGPPIYHGQSVFCAVPCIRKEIDRYRDWLKRDDGNAPWVVKRNTTYQGIIEGLELLIARQETEAA